VEGLMWYVENSLFKGTQIKFRMELFTRNSNV
jgi:hypothetical protein